MKQNQGRNGQFNAGAFLHLPPKCMRSSSLSVRAIKVSSCFVLGSGGRFAVTDNLKHHLDPSRFYLSIISCRNSFRIHILV